MHNPMGTVHQFRKISFTDSNNLREAQAREVIDAWVTRGYSLRYIVVEALVSYRSEDGLNNELEKF